MLSGAFLEFHINPSDSMKNKTVELKRHFLLLSFIHRWALAPSFMQLKGNYKFDTAIIKTLGKTLQNLQSMQQPMANNASVALLFIHKQCKLYFIIHWTSFRIRFIWKSEYRFLAYRPRGEVETRVEWHLDATWCNPIENIICNVFA